MSRAEATRYAVIGHPIAHSKSPLIHAYFAEQTGVSLRYEPVLAPVDGFAGVLAELRTQGLQGCNVTVPFKLEACAYADTHSEDVLWAGAANTLSFAHGRNHADNTDGVGLVRDLTQNLGLSLAGRHLVLLGAGGAARGVLRPLLLARPAAITVVNRSLDKAQAWLDDIRRHADFDAICGQTQVKVAAWHTMDLGLPVDGVINATASGLTDEFTPPQGVVLQKTTLAYDMMYGKETGFSRWASSHGARVADGWGMLVEQAAKSFEIWHGITPDTRALIEQRDAFLTAHTV